MGGGRVLGGTGSSTRNKQQTKRGKLITVQDDPHRPRKTKCNCDNVAALTRVIAADPDHPSFQQQQQILPRNLLRTCRCHPPEMLFVPNPPSSQGDFRRDETFTTLSDKPQWHIVAIDFTARAGAGTLPYMYLSGQETLYSTGITGRTGSFNCLLWKLVVIDCYLPERSCKYFFNYAVLGFE